MAYRYRKDIVGKRFLCVHGFGEDASSFKPLHTNKRVNGIHLRNKQSYNGERDAQCVREPALWAWRAGVVRAATHRNTDHPDLQLLLEYDDVSWEQREWISIHQAGIFHVFLVEHNLVWAPLYNNDLSTQLQVLRYWPALEFSSIVNHSHVQFRVQRLEVDSELLSEYLTSESDIVTCSISPVKEDKITVATAKEKNHAGLRVDIKVGQDKCSSHRVPVDTSNLVAIEYLLDKRRAFIASDQLRPFQNWESFELSAVSNSLPSSEVPQGLNSSSSLEFVRSAEVKEAVRQWAEIQAGQRILVTTPSIVVGYRAQVYRAEGATQWYTAVIVSHDEETGELTLTDDTVLEEHYEDPRLLQIKLLGEGVVESILRGETVGITPRRSRSSALAGKALIHCSPSSSHSGRSPNYRRSSKDGDQRHDKIGKSIKNTAKVKERKRKSNIIATEEEDSSTNNKTTLHTNKPGAEEKETAVKTSSVVEIIPVCVARSVSERKESASEGATRILTVASSSTSVTESDARSKLPPVKDVKYSAGLAGGSPSGLVIIPLPPRNLAAQQHDKHYSLPSVITTTATAIPTIMDRDRSEDDRDRNSGVNNLGRSGKGSPVSSPPNSIAPVSTSAAGQRSATSTIPKRPVEPTFSQATTYPLQHYIGLPPHSTLPFSLPTGIPPSPYGSHHAPTDLYWRNPFTHLGVGTSYIPPHPSAGQHDELLIRERERRELEAKELRERERLEKEKDRERLEKEKDRERERQEQAVKRHFEESLLRLQQKSGVPAQAWSHLTMQPKGSGHQQPLPSTNRNHLSTQDRDKERDRDRYMAAFNASASGERDRESVRGHANNTASSTAGPPSMYTALPRADLSFSVHGYQTAQSPTPSRKAEISATGGTGIHPSILQEYKGGVIVGPGERVESRDARPELRDLRIEPRDHRIDSRDQRLDARFEARDQRIDQRVEQRIENREQRSTLTFKPYETSSRPTAARTSRSPLHTTPPTTSSSGYPLHYPGPGPGPTGPGPGHSYSPSPSNRSVPPSGASVNYMHPPSVSPSRSPASIGHSTYPGMRYSPAPPTPIPSTSPSAIALKKSSPSPSQVTGTSYGRQVAAVPVGTAGITTGTPVCRNEPVQTMPLSLTTPSKCVPSHATVEAVPPPAHTVRNDRDRDRDRDVRIYSRTAYSPLTHTLPPPQPLVNQTPRSNQAPIHQQQPLDLGTYREGSPIPLISTTRLSTGEPQSKKTRHDIQVGFPGIGVGAPLLSVAALVDAANAAAAHGKPPDSVYAFGLTPRPSAGISPLLTNTNLVAEVKQEAIQPKIEPTNLPENLTSAAPQQEADQTASSTSISPSSQGNVSDSKITSNPLPTSTNSNGGSSSGNNSSANTRPVHKLKTAWLQRHAGGDEPAKSPFASSTVETKSETPLNSSGADQPTPSPSKPTRKHPASTATGSSTRPAGVNGYGTNSPQNVTEDEQPNVGGRSGKRKAGKAAVNTNKERRAKQRANAPAPTSAASSTGSSTDDGSDSDGESNGTRPKKGPTSASRETKSGVGRGSGAQSRQRSSDSSSSSKEGQPLRKGRGPAAANATGNSKTGNSNPFNKPPIAQLKKTGESFLQDGACWEVAPRLAKCRECRLTPHQRKRNEQQSNANIFCRFYAFRRLRYTKTGQLAIAGFSDPIRDPSDDDLKLWLPQPEKATHDLDVEMSLFLLTHVGDQFCLLVRQEKEAKSAALAAKEEDGEQPQQQIAWKRVVQGVREMCDVCETTLFNFHWACGKCGYVVCIDCYKTRKAAQSQSNSNGTGAKDDEKEEKDKERDAYGWLFCTSRSGHDPDKLMPTQIIAGDGLECMGHMVHTIRKHWNITQFCDCPEAIECNKAIEASNGNSINPGSNGICKNINSAVVIKQEKQSDAVSNGDVESKTVEREDSKTLNGTCDTGDQKGSNQQNNSPLTWLADVALAKDKRSNSISNLASKNGSTTSQKDPTSASVKEEPSDGQILNGSDADSEAVSEDEENNEQFSTLRELLIRPAPKTNAKSSEQSAPIAKKQRIETLEDVISCVIEHGVDRESNQENLGSSSQKNKECVGNNGESNEVVVNVELKHFKRRADAYRTIRTREPLPVRIMVGSESLNLYPDIPHSWLCSGKLLRLHDPLNPMNYKIFQDQWKRGQPVIVSGVSQLLDKQLWHPDSFTRDFGDLKNDLVNCSTGNLVPNQPMKKFWEGFERLTKRLKDEKGQYMLLKLKDWPPGEDFAEMLPSRYTDLMKALPMAEYTHRNGRLNLAGRLPECFVRPDLGPKMYNAYGSALVPNKGTTNLHIDVSDAANVMVYVGLPKEANSEEYIKEALKAIDEAGCDYLTRQRVREAGELPGALWHIYQARDADRIRDFLNKVALERGERLEPHHDAIHDQSWYLNGQLRARLYKEYGVSGYAVVQCLGDVVFIPAGAPHQVRNLHSCIKVAEDFVSPENVAHCFQLTQEFRALSDTHTNHEDKLQIKNIIYHAIKDSISVLSHGENLTSAELLRIYGLREENRETKS